MLLTRLKKIRLGIASKASVAGLALAMPVILMAGSASAASWCNYNSLNGHGYCMSTQGGRVTACDDPSGNHGGGSCFTPYIDFSLRSAGSPGVSEISADNYTGCVGDYGNDSSNASTDLERCPSAGNAGWGTKQLASSCSNPLGSGYQFYNVHWTAFVGPQDFFS
ncbi:MAG TPA: hypothetical protein VLG47_05370, partial [Candidatus Saccharimonadales bacterium]|nr:hypothetical protein [Candidatus Saccharimonadales bacterium]